MRNRALSLLFAALFLVPLACGRVKGREDRVVQVQGAGTPGSSSGSGDAFDQLRELLKLYGESGGLGRTGLQNFLERFRGQIEPVLLGAGIEFDSLVRLLFQWDRNADDLLQPREVLDGLEERTRILPWFRNAEALSPDEIEALLSRDFAASSPMARASLARRLGRFDLAWAGGNGDGFLQKKELSLPALLLAVVLSTDFSKEPLFSGDDPLKKALGSQLTLQIRQRLAGRYTSVEASELGAEDVALEWASVALDLLLVDKRVRSVGGDVETKGGLEEKDQEAALADLGFPADVPNWQRIRDYYDSALLGGTGEKRLNSVELFLMVTDAEFAQRFVQGGKVDRKLLRAVFPISGLTVVTLAYADETLPLYDTPEKGGDADGALSWSEFQLALAQVKTVEALYAGYDRNGDRLLSKPEMKTLLQAVAPEFNDDTIIDAFFADVGLDDGGFGLWNWLQLQFSGADVLEPGSFHSRFLKILPRLLAKDTKPRKEP